MRRIYRLEAHNGLGPALEFEWDAETGELAGRDAEEVRQWAEEARRAGYCIGAPHPTPYKVTDPLRNPGELAIILGGIWRLPPDLAAAYPKPAAADVELPPGAIP